MIFSRPLASLLAVLALVAQPAVADEAAVLVRSPIPQGLDGLMPRGGAYERALEASARGAYRLAADLFGTAGAELRHVGRQRRDGEPRRATLRALLRKTNLHAEEAFFLAAAVPIGGQENPIQRAPEQRLREILTANNLYLAHRAFHGRESRPFRARIEAFYRAALAAPADPADTKTSGIPQAGATRIHLQLGLAGLLADGGDFRAAAIAFAAVPAADRTAEVVDLVAHYYATIGRPDDAFDALFSARDELPDWRQIASVLRISNDLDALRLDPRFARIVGPES